MRQRPARPVRQGNMFLPDRSPVLTAAPTWSLHEQRVTPSTGPGGRRAAAGAPRLTGCAAARPMPFALFICWRVRQSAAAGAVQRTRACRGMPAAASCPPPGSSHALERAGRLAGRVRLLLCSVDDSAASPPRRCRRFCWQATRRPRQDFRAARAPSDSLASCWWPPLLEGRSLSPQWEACRWLWSRAEDQA